MDRRKTFTVLALIVLATLPVMPVRTQSGNGGQVRQGAEESTYGVYIVQLAGAAVPNYRGSLPHFAPTSIAMIGGTRLDVNSPASVAYRNYLMQQQETFIQSIEKAMNRDIEVNYQYQLALNGLALELTAGEADMVAALEDVVTVEPDWIVYPQSDVSHTWIGAGKIWDGTANNGAGTLGEGMVIGIIDSGINMDHPSFAGIGGDGYHHDNPRGIYYQFCDPDHPRHAELTTPCNDKLIGVWSADADPAEDAYGHGSHVAGTAAGNMLTITMHAPTMAISATISGIAPRANIIAYNIEGTPGTGYASGSATLAAVEAAIADGVDVINYSYGDPPGSPWTPSGLAWANATQAGILVITSAGNSGPTPGTNGMPGSAPWMLTVANSTHNRKLRNGLINMEGGDSPPEDMEGKSVTAGYGPAPIVYAGAYSGTVTLTAPNSTLTITLDYETARLCRYPFPPGTFAGEIVVCDRGGGIARVTKGINVLAGGAGGMVLTNDAESGNSLNADTHVLPAVHITCDDGIRLRAWLAGTAVQKTATIAGTTLGFDDAYGDQMNASSSRGPNFIPQLIKPDVAAPGTDILAAVHTTVPGSPPEFNFYTGTSMASPNTAGAALLLRKLHPTWTPMEVQSALMSTSVESVSKEDGVTPATPFDVGAGRIDVALANRAGFVLDEEVTKMRDAAPAYDGDPAALNLASLAQPECLEQCRWTRALSSTMAITVTWEISGIARDFTLTLIPDHFELAPGAVQTVTITADVSHAAPDTWLFGVVRFTPDVTQTVPAHFPVAVTRSPSNLPALKTIDTPLKAGTTQVEDIIAMEITRLTVDIHGMAQADLVEQFIVEDPNKDSPYDEGGTFYITRTVTAGDMRLVAEIITTTSPDLDMRVTFDANRNGIPESEEKVCVATTIDVALESCSIQDDELKPGTYHILVQNYVSGQTSATLPDRVVLGSAVVPKTDTGTLAVTGPTPVTGGSPFDLNLTWDVTSGITNDLGMTTHYWYGAFEVGTDAENRGNLGQVLVNLRYKPGAPYYGFMPVIIRGQQQ
ncbi:MAG: S8 family serine peptidase [Anaerolineae bacterium]|nr:S8 family serine peptidase [Anaerolineae bacterium]